MLSKVVRILLAFVAVLVAIYVVLALLSQPMPDHPFFASDDVLVIAHQGGDGLRPSNTMAAFQNAVDMGVDVLEMDIHSTKDGVLVVIHDDTIDRTTDGSGRVQDYTFEELQAFDAGYDWPTLEEESGRTDRPFRGQGITIPSLEEIFTAFPDYLMNIEIKQKEPSIVPAFCDLMRQYNMTEKVLVGSFHSEPMAELKELCPEVAVSAQENDIRTFYVLNTIGLGAIYRPSTNAFQVPEYAGDMHVVTPGFVNGAHAHNLDVHVWTVNEMEQMQRMIDAGVDGIISDYPDRVLEVLGR
jgi:glycerophosphoryl diester phosphodiesterase